LIDVQNDDLEIGNDALNTYLRSSSSGKVTIGVKSTDLIFGSGDGVAFFDVGDFGGGEGVISIDECSVVPTTTIVGTACDLYNTRGALYAWGPANFGMTVVPVVSGASGTLTRKDEYVARLSQDLGNAVETLLDIPLRGATSIMRIDIDVLGKVADATFSRRRMVVINNNAPGDIVQTDVIGTDVDNIAGGIALGLAISGTDYRISVTGSTTGSVKWVVFATVHHHEP
jgi:hypothetical protein